jgi:HEPN domain-containing protein
MAEKIGVEDYVKAAENKLEAARKEYEVAIYPSAVLDACFALDNAVNAYLMAIGARPAKRHRWTLAITNATKQTNPQLLKGKLFRETLRLIKEVEAGAHIVRSRYPFTLRGEKFVPDEYYTVEITSEIIEKTERIFSGLLKIIDELEK